MSLVSRRRLPIGALVLALVVGTGLGGSAEAAPAGPAVSLLPDGAVPRGVARAARPVEVGLRFRVTAPSRAVGVQFYKVRSNKGRHTATLWSGRGRRLARITFRHETRAGLQQARFSKPVRLRPGRDYVVSYTARAGRYSVDRRYFTRAISNGLLVARRRAGVFSPRAGRFPTHTHAASSYAVDIVVRPRASQSQPVPAGFPDASNTGVPAGVALTPYPGPCRITTAGTVIDGKTVNCDLAIAAANVTIRNTVVNGTIDTSSGSSGLLVADSEIRIGDHDGTGIGNTGFTAERVEVTGGNRSINCELNCTVRDSYVHGQFTDETGYFHESGIRMGAGSTLIHNTITCDAPDVPPDAGCSAGLTGYGDFAAVENNLIQNNLFRTTTGGTCAYGGSSAGKPYSNGANNIRFIGNTFERGRTGYCGKWAPIMDFNRSAPGNVWSGNVWVNGGTVSAR